ncbi:ankyrin repeat and SOCS box protein 6 [Gallus gallus]|uniref:Ankyrin repeat and SOCS box containing 6 n=1 Tax=Gallus gallus TaxID=9031 RepID=A0A8V1ABN0_CHICK|nr:ankyrin repeat and SOCS box protein 6 [Gallus gallus]NP_001383587.1 ankyrin repeat and SOCS box protein 6 [Gallus gallus]NP_001383588.1 ankyrin repeat and SOCS box protein 6 [Gallus gallus]XP_046757736.1 ankyrin repeat and SOCS box protein 6 isoform X1 [Gallus gallus]
MREGPAGPVCRAQRSRMPFLHGFRRITLEYQPLVDEILALLALQDAERQDTLESHACLGSNGSQLSAMRQVLEREAHSPFYQEGVSYTLLKVTELGLVEAAEVLLEFGAHLSFEDPVTYYTPLHIAVLRNQPDMVELLARHGADINRRDRIHESSPLDLASEEPERLPCLQRLLQLGADVNAADKTGKTALLHALLHCYCSSDVVQIHNTESIRLLLEGGADARATTEDGDTVFTYIIFLLGDIVLASTEEAEVQNRFCIRVMQLLMAHGANPSECPSLESFTYRCLQNFTCHFPLLRFLLESGAAYNCSLHGPSCWSGFQTVFDCLCSHVSILKDSSISTEVIQMGQTLLELMMASSQTIQLPSDFEVDVNSCRYHEEKIRTLFCSVKQLEHTPQALKHLCRVFIRQRLRPWPIDIKIKALPLPDRLKWYLLIDHAAVGHEDLSLTDDSPSPHSVVTVPPDSQQITALHPLSLQ